MIEALRAHRVNTLVELRRIEKALAVLGSPDITEPMTAACESFRYPGICRVADYRSGLGSYYVNCHSLLTELRGLTKNYPFRYFEECAALTVVSPTNRSGDSAHPIDTQSTRLIFPASPLMALSSLVQSPRAAHPDFIVPAGPLICVLNAAAPGPDC